MKLQNANAALTPVDEAAAVWRSATAASKEATRKTAVRRRGRSEKLGEAFPIIM